MPSSSIARIAGRSWGLPRPRSYKQPLGRIMRCILFGIAELWNCGGYRAGTHSRGAMSEFALQAKILAALRSNAGTWRNVPITKSTSEARTMYDLLGDREHGRDFDLHTEKPLMKGSSVLSVELFHGLKPDIVVWSKRSAQNRIVIEVKQATKATHKEDDASQFLRYFLHLLVTSDPRPKGKADIDRGFLVAAPTTWFESQSLSHTWHHFVKHYGPLAETFHITLGELHADNI